MKTAAELKVGDRITFTGEYVYVVKKTKRVTQGDKIWYEVSFEVEGGGRLNGGQPYYYEADDDFEVVS